MARLLALLTVMKGLPLAYQKDMQEDKVPVFEAVDALELCLAATTGMVRDMHPDRERLRAAPDAASAPRPISPTGSCAARRCRSARRISHRRDRQARRGAGALRSLSCRSPNCSEWSRRSPLRYTTCSMSIARLPAAPALAALRR